MTSLFITSSGTGIGKTLVTAILARQMTARGDRVDAMKPIVSGFEPVSIEENDTAILLNALDLVPTAAAIDRMSPWRFEAPLSPDMAARRENRRIDFDELVALCAERARSTDPILIEGVGGVMVPLTDTRTVLDWIEVLAIPALLVIGSYLGTISHTLTALTALRHRAVAVAGVVISESPESPVPLQETAAAIARFEPTVRIALLPRLPQPTNWDMAPDLLGPLGL